MALVTQQVQGGYTTFPSCSLPCNRGRELKFFFPRLNVVRRSENISMKCGSCRSVGTPLVQGLTVKSFKILSFKGIGQSEELGNRASGLTSTKSSVKLSYVPQENDETLTETPKAQKLSVSYSSEADETTAGSLAIQRLFKNWLTLLRMPSSNHVVVDETLERPTSAEVSETKNGVQNKERGEILKAVWCYFLSLDATIKIPLLIFIPLYLVVNVICGVEVSKELAPLWILGPLIVALYIKMFQGLCALYVFSFKKTIKVFKSLPTYCLVASNYITCGKLKEDIRACLWQPVLDIKNLDYKEASKRKMKDLEGWLVEKYLDFVESIWPYYCRTIRFLKRANLI